MKDDAKPLLVAPFRAWTIRWRLTAWYALTSLIVLIVAGTVVYYSFRTTFVHDTDRSLTIKGMEVIYSAAGPELLHRSKNFIVPPLAPTTLLANFRGQFEKVAYDPLGDPIYMRLLDTDSSKVVLTSSNIKQHDLIQWTLDQAHGIYPSQTVNGQFVGGRDYDELRIVDIRVPRENYVLQLATPWARYEDALSPMVNIIAGVIVFGFALSAIGGWILVGRTLQPISEIVAEASKMSGNRLEPAFVAARTLADDEIGDLVTALNQMMSRVQAAIECQRQFTADASHDLKTPLAILRGEMELALDRDRSIDEYRGVLVSGLEETERLIRIVSDLRELANADLDQVSSVRRSECDLVDLAANVVDSRTHYAIMRNVSLKMIESKGMHKIVMWVDPVAIERAIANLVDNAIHYNRSPGQVKVYVQKEDDAAVLKVYDTGIGIDESDKEFIFDRFYRGDKSRSKTGLNDRSNSGLGLAIVKSIVTSHGGSVKVESKVGDGSTFTIRLPMEQPAARQATEAMRKV